MRAIASLNDGTDVLDYTGDLDSPNYGGGIVYKNRKTGSIFWSFWDEREAGEKNFIVYTSRITRDPISSYCNDIAELSLVSGLDKRELKKLSSSKKWKDRLDVLILIRESNGASFICDEEPAEITEKEFSSRWGKVFGINHEEIELFSIEDFLIIETQEGYEVGTFSEKWLGKFPTFAKCLFAAARDIDMYGRHHSRVFFEHEFGDLELVSWDKNEFKTQYIDKKSNNKKSIKWRNIIKKYNKLNKNCCSISSKDDNILKSRQRASNQAKRKRRIDRARRFRRSVYGEDA